jgi:hypothetical protein
VATIEELVRAINRDLSPQFEERLRTALADKDREWLIDQLVRLTLDSHSLEDLDVAAAAASKAHRRAERVARVTAMAVDDARVRDFTGRFAGMSRERAIAEGYILDSAPIKGTDSISSDHRTASGEEVLTLAKDMLFSLLFGDSTSSTTLDRVQQELLTLAVPRSKAGELDFMRASTELAAAGT